MVAERRQLRRFEYSVQDTNIQLIGLFGQTGQSWKSRLMLWFCQRPRFELGPLRVVAVPLCSIASFNLRQLNYLPHFSNRT